MTLSAASTQNQLRFADDLELEIEYADDTRFGSLTSGRLLREIRTRCRGIVEHWHRHQGTATIAKSQTLFDEALAGALGELFIGRDKLHPEALYPPDRAVKPVTLVAIRERKEIMRAALSPSLSAELARWLGDWVQSAVAPRSGDALSLYTQLAEVGAFTSAAAVPAIDTSCQFVGHAALAVGSLARGRVLIDPYLLPHSTRFGNYQPMGPAQLSGLGAICITHSHPDHFALGSLLRLGADTRILVPRVPRESALSIGMAARLVELGFSRVEEIGWGEHTSIPGGRILALPLFGEQPTTGARLHEEVRNHGNTYLVEIDSTKIWAVADSGKDSDGDPLTLGEKLRADVGPIDVLFGGYRAFPTYPIEFIASSVPQYALFTPHSALLRRQKIMQDADDLMDLAECLDARHVVPYACGGAPWYWERGLGPTVGDNLQRNLGDIGPEVVMQAARARTGTFEEPHASPSQVVILRPGDAFEVSPGSLRVSRREPYAWPFARNGKRGIDASTGATSGFDEDEVWLQFNVAMNDLSPAEFESNAWLLFRRVLPLVNKLKATGQCESFFFQRKGPGLRMRFEVGPGTVVNPIGEVRYELERARRSGAIEAYAEAPYEPEVRVFGGPEGMAAAHRYFDVDTSLFLDWLALGRSSMAYPVLDRELWLGLVADDLVVSCVNEQAECWDVYSNLLARHPGVEADPSAAPLPPQVDFASQGERDLFVKYRAANRRLAADINALLSAGKLRVGRRLLVSDVVQFQLNRYLITPQAQQALVQRLLVTRPREGAASSAHLTRPKETGPNSAPQVDTPRGA